MDKLWCGHGFLLFTFRMCMSVYMYVHSTYICMFALCITCVLVCRSTKITSGVFSIAIHFIFWGRVSCWDLWIPVRLASLFALGSQPLKCQDYKQPSHLPENLNSGSHACMASMLSTQPTPQPIQFSFCWVQEEEIWVTLLQTFRSSKTDLQEDVPVHCSGSSPVLVIMSLFSCSHSIMGEYDGAGHCGFDFYFLNTKYHWACFLRT